MSDEALLAAIAEAPDDDAPRLVFADALSQRGDPWGEIIVLSCELARRPQAEEVESRLDELMRERFVDVGFTRTFRRGFCTALHLRNVSVAGLAGPEMRVLEKLVVESPTSPLLEELATWPPVEGLRALRIASPGADRAAVMTLVERTAAVDIDVTHTSFLRDDLEVLVAKPGLRRLAIAVSSLRGTLHGLSWPPLEDLRLRGSHLVGDDVAGLAASEALRGLRKLELSHNDIASVDALATWPFTRLDSLLIQGCPLDRAAIARLAASPSLAGLTELALGNHSLVIEGGFAQAFPSVTQLRLVAHRVHDIVALARPYETLALELGSLDSPELERLLNRRELRSLRSLSIDMGSVPTRLALALANAPLPELEVLVLTSCGIDEMGAALLAATPYLRRDLRLTVLRDDLGRAAPALRARFPNLYPR